MYIRHAVRHPQASNNDDGQKTNEFRLVSFLVESLLLILIFDSHFVAHVHTEPHTAEACAGIYLYLLHPF